MKKSVVLDTSLFVNPDSGRYFGSDPTTSFDGFLTLAQKAKHLEFFMPPSIYSELMHFADETKISKDKLLLIHKKPPKKHEIKIPGALLYNLVEDMRDRVDRGLRLSERVVREAILLVPPSGPTASPQTVRPDAEMIGRLRDSYRRIMREGMLDSKADVDMLLLTYEIDGILVSADMGVLAWAESLGLSTIAHDHLREFLQEHAPALPS